VGRAQTHLPKVSHPTLVSWEEGKPQRCQRKKEEKRAYRLTASCSKKKEGLAKTLGARPNKEVTLSWLYTK